MELSSLWKSKTSMKQSMPWKKHGIEFYFDPMDTPLGRIAIILDPDGSKICICERDTEGVA